MNAYWLSLALEAALLLSGLLSASGHPHLNVLSYYETLNYEPSELMTEHARMTRKVRDHTSKAVNLNLEAFNRSFVSSLTHAKGVFGPSVRFLVGGVKSTDYDPLTFYRGQLKGDPKSHVTGHIIDGVFDGTIQSNQGTFHVERAHKFFPVPQDFHSIIYHEDDVRGASPSHAPSCGVKGELLEQLRSVASHAVPLEDEDKKILYGEDRHSRLRRQTVNNNRFCQVRVAADHLFLASVGGGSVINTMSEVVTIFSAVQMIFAATNFDGVGLADQVQPVITSLEVLRQGTPGYRFGAGSIPVNDFLDLWSQEDQSEFCLSLLLTHRDFANGVLGLAWVAQPPGGNRGGICEVRVRLQAGERYLNTAIVTFLNYGQRQPRSVSTITIAHELGHNFGSPHDSSGSCSPGGSQGNFIMFPQATDGALENNRRFSSCSIGSIRGVLQTKSTCFTATEAFCGNGIKEMGEECDCGTMCDADRCCDNCTLTLGSQCSSLQPCCNASCMFEPLSELCLAESECGESSFCTGAGGSCPSPVPKDENLLCNGGRNVCINGLCSGSVCIRMNMTDCQCTTQGGAEETTLCHVCCRQGTGGTCQTSFDLFGTDVGQFREGGRSCNNFLGYCSNESPPKCVIVDNERVLEDLLDIFNLNTIHLIGAWLERYWYIIAAVVVVIAIFIVLLQVTYRKRKPLKKKINRIRNSTLRRNRTTTDSATPSSRAPPSRTRGGNGRGQREISLDEGERRLKQFFPTVDRETMVSVMRGSRSESKAVKRMIELGYPLRKLPLPRS